MNKIDRAEIIFNFLKIYKKIQLAGGTPAVRGEVFDVFNDILLCTNKEELEEVSVKFIKRG